MKLPKREQGQGLVEYALLLVLVAIVVIGILGLLGNQVKQTFTEIVNILGGGGGYTYEIQSFSVSANTVLGKCEYTVSGSVRVTDSGSGAPVADGFSVTGTVSGDISLTATGTVSGGNGVSSSSGSITETGACPSGGHTATLTVPGDSMTASW